MVPQHPLDCTYLFSEELLFCGGVGGGIIVFEYPDVGTGGIIVFEYPDVGSVRTLFAPTSSSINSPISVQVASACSRSHCVSRSLCGEKTDESGLSMTDIGSLKFGPNTSAYGDAADA